MTSKIISLIVAVVVAVASAIGVVVMFVYEMPASAEHFHLSPQIEQIDNWTTVVGLSLITMIAVMIVVMRTRSIARSAVARQ